MEGQVPSPLPFSSSCHRRMISDVKVFGTCRWGSSSSLSAAEFGTVSDFKSALLTASFPDHVVARQEASQILKDEQIYCNHCELHLLPILRWASQPSSPSPYGAQQTRPDRFGSHCCGRPNMISSLGDNSLFVVARNPSSNPKVNTNAKTGTREH